MMKKIICFNGPPGSGKDTAVRALGALCTEHKLLAVHNKMSKQLKDGVHRLFNLAYDPSYYEGKNERHLKDEPLASLFGLTPREAYISVSEEYLKPKFGDDVIGKMMLNTMKKQKADVHVFSDGGFSSEWLPIIDHFGPDNFLLVEIYGTKGGHEIVFHGDSRDYIGGELSLVRSAVTVRKVYNDIGGIEDREIFRMMVLGACKKFLEIDT